MEDLSAQVRGNTDPSPELIDQVNNTLNDTYVSDKFGLGSDYSVYDGRFEGVTLDIWMPDLYGTSKMYPDFSQHPVMQQISKLTGIKLNFITPTLGEEKTEFNLMLSGGELPDIIINGIRYYTGGELSAAEDGVIMDLTPYQDKLPNYMTFLGNCHEDQRRAVVVDDGRMLCMYTIGSYEPYLADTAVYKAKAMEDAGWTEVPETVDEWYSFMTDCKNAGYDIPMELITQTGFLTNSCVASAYGVFRDLFVNDEGKVAYGPVQDGAEDYLQTMNKWYVEGLIDPDFATGDANHRNSMIASDSTAMEVMSNSTFVDLVGGAPCLFGKYPVLNKGDQLQVDAFFNNVSGSVGAITTQCKNVDAALAFMDFFYTKKGWFVCNHGSYGDVCLVDEEGIPYYPKDGLIFTDPEIVQNAGTYLTSKYRLHNYVTAKGFPPTLNDNTVSEQACRDIVDGAKWVGLPSLSLTPEESSQVTDIATNIRTLQHEYYTKIIMGQLPVSAVQEFRDKAEQMGLDTYVSVYQDAYDRYLAR